MSDTQQCVSLFLSEQREAETNNKLITNERHDLSNRIESQEPYLYVKNPINSPHTNKKK